jgi:hypothetical protein
MEQIIKDLIGKRITILKEGEIGFLHCIECKAQKVYRKPYAHYKDLLHVEYKPKGKRVNRLWRVMEYSSCAIFEGYIKLQTDIWESHMRSSDMKEILESFLAFSEGSFDQALASTPQKPVYVYRKIQD